jgi:protein-tyrosine phosphatase
MVQHTNGRYVKSYYTIMIERREMIYSQIQKIVGQMEEPSQITEYLYLGSEWNSANIKELQRLEITSICNVGAECPNYYPKHFVYLNIKVSSSDIDVDIASQLDTFFEFVETTIQSKGVLLVHSHLGVSRSASYCIAWMMRKNGWSLQKAYKYVKDKRKIVKPSQECMRQLIQYDIKLFGQQSLGVHATSGNRTSTPSPLNYIYGSPEYYGSPDADSTSFNFISTEVFNRMRVHNEAGPNTPTSNTNIPDWNEDHK